MWKQLAILCVCIPLVHHLKEKIVSLAVFWPIKIQADVAGINQRNIKESLGRYVPGYRLDSWKWFPFHCCSCWNGLNLLFLKSLVFLVLIINNFFFIWKRETKPNQTNKQNPQKVFIGLQTSSVRTWSQTWLEISQWLLEDWSCQGFHFCGELIFCS